MQRNTRSCDELFVQRYIFATQVRKGHFESALEMHDFATLPARKCRKLLEEFGVKSEQINAFLKRQCGGYVGVFRQSSKEFTGFRLGDMSEFSL